MFWKLVREPFRRPRSRRRALLAVAAIGLGTAVAAAMLSVSLDVGDRVGNELRSLGANIEISPAADSLPVEIGGMDYRPVSEGAYIPESALPKLKQIFWRNNILAFAPFLYAPAQAKGPSGSVSAILVGTWFDYPVVRTGEEEFLTGIRALNPTWKLEGEWVDDSFSADSPLDAVIGRSLAENLSLRSGDVFDLTINNGEESAQATSVRTVRVKGILTTGGAEDDQVFASLAAVQSWVGMENKVRKVQVSALIKPEDELSRGDPAAMTPVEYDRWYCSPYLSSILHQISLALPGTTGRAVRQVAETQGSVLGKLTFLMTLLAIVALLAAALSISSLANLTILERRQEIGLMKAMGAQDWLVGCFFLTEMSIQALAGGVLGFAGGHLLAQLLGLAIFGAEVTLNWLVLPAVLVVALGVSLAGTWAPIRRAMREDPARVLQGV
jgi:putative ABC transport system permease protein